VETLPALQMHSSESEGMQGALCRQGPKVRSSGQVCKHS
jgi:hypothetical protein